MAGKVKPFDRQTQRYLRTLPAVDAVTATRIYYMDEFRREVMRRYDAGGSPTAIFRENGLDPKIIGYKRIERAIARWKSCEAKPHNLHERDADIDAEADGEASRDMLIVSQAPRIVQLEQRVHELEQRVHELELQERIRWRFRGNHPMNA